MLKEISPECSLKWLLLNLKLQYFGHLVQKADSFENTLMLGKIEGRRRRGQQRTRWLDSFCFLNLIDYFLSMLGRFSTNLFKNFLMPFLFLFFFWDPYNLNVGVFDSVPEVSETLLSSFISFFFFFFFLLYSALQKLFPLFYLLAYWFLLLFLLFFSHLFLLESNYFTIL